MNFGKRQLVAGALVIALGAAVYLNWQFSQNEALTVNDSGSSETGKQLGQATYVNTAASNTEQEESKQESTSQESSTAETSVSDNLTDAQKTFFANEKLSRQQSRDESVELLQEIISSVTSDESAKTKAVEEAAEISALIKTESDIESMIKSKGFEECIVFINNDKCSVVVSKGNLNENTAVAIKDIVNTHGGIDFDKITISEV